MRPALSLCIDICSSQQQQTQRALSSLPLPTKRSGRKPRSSISGQPKSAQTKKPMDLPSDEPTDPPPGGYTLDYLAKSMTDDLESITGELSKDTLESPTEKGGDDSDMHIDEEFTNQLEQEDQFSEEDLKKVVNRKRLDVAIVGLPNAGKSQLLNMMTKSTVSAVSRKRHTTRNSEIMGGRTILEENDKTTGTQLLFVDTPGFLRVSQARPEGLERRLITDAKNAMSNVDFTVLVVDAARSLKSDEYKGTIVSLMMSAMQCSGRTEFREDEDAIDSEEMREEVEYVGTQGEELVPKFAVVLNKVDLVSPKKKLIGIAQELCVLADESLTFLVKESATGELVQTMTAGTETKVSESDIAKLMPPVFYTDSRSGEGIDDLVKYLTSRGTPSQDWPLDLNQSTNLPLQKRIVEVIREKLFRVMHKEVPYAIEQQNRVLKKGLLQKEKPIDKDYEAVARDEDKPYSTTEDEEPKEGVLIHQDLVVYSKSHRDLLQSSGGRNLKAIKDTAIPDLEKLLGAKVVLHLHVRLVTSKNKRAPGRR
eukprot:CAMPEP_0172455272 /NCGR_PEP_ID=MMETSP1065-20121228/11983_1 /TAXON_ID=265537 /ORGANISM="Amphiprora paludosa, Strain CCMP125" /LENGTH=536 /DNA_ID=CAMNT_0013207733 /DNA_START=1 /DNA_END=1611 /DNA_ORIENTATION=+